jgi:hypothetical protein
VQGPRRSPRRTDSKLADQVRHSISSEVVAVAACYGDVAVAVVEGGDYFQFCFFPEKTVCALSQAHGLQAGRAGASLSLVTGHSIWSLVTQFGHWSLNLITGNSIWSLVTQFGIAGAALNYRTYTVPLRGGRKL